jgi:signal transduction histidine kinase
MKKLLNRSIRPLILYSLVVLILSIPVYFYIINKIWVNELDDHHSITKAKIEKQFNSLNYQEPRLSETIHLWNTLQHGVLIKPADASAVQPDHFYTITRFDEYHDEKEQFRGLVSYIYILQKPYQVTIETNMEEVDETIIAIAGVALGFFLLLLVGFIILNRQVSGRIWKPFYNTMDQLKTFDLNGNTAIHLERSGTWEFEQLNETVTHLIESNVAIYKQQKEFTENASHELQTPLTIIKSKLDVWLQDPALTKEQAEMIESLNLPLSRASRINKNLLLLAKIENQQFDNEQVDLGELLNQDIELLSEHIENKKISIEKHIQSNTILHCNKSLVEILLTNLLLNAIRHSPENGKIKVDLTAQELIFSNTGTTSLNPGTLFKRFISNSTETPSSGLGLAIVKQVCNRFNWQIKYNFRENFHIFTVVF